MTDREIMQQALEALEQHSAIQHPQQRHYRDAAIAALRERLAQPEQEPVAFVDPIWMQRPDLIIEQRLEIKKLFARVQVMDYVPLYTAPQSEPVIDKSAAIRIATALGWVPPSDTSQERVDEAGKQRQEHLPSVLEVAVKSEREACAKLCEARYMGDNTREDMEARRCAAAIRARGQV